MESEIDKNNRIIKQIVCPNCKDLRWIHPSDLKYLKTKLCFKCAHTKENLYNWKGGKPKCKYCGTTTSNYDKFGCRKCYTKRRRAIPLYKKCTLCKQEKDIIDFEKYWRTSRDRYQFNQWCKSCAKKKHKEWRNRNGLKLRAYQSNRYTLMKDLTVEKIQTVYENNINLYKTLTCYLCLKSIQFGDDCLEHKTPLSRGGTNDLNNLDVAHRSCNSRKRKKTEVEYRFNEMRKISNVRIP